MDFQNVLSCRLVKKSWKDLIDKMASKIKWEHVNNVLWTRVDMEVDIYMHQWTVFINIFNPLASENEIHGFKDISEKSISLINYYLLQFFNDETITFQDFLPLQAFVLVRNLKMIELILTKNMSDPPYNDFWKGFQDAIIDRDIEIMKIFKNVYPNPFQEHRERMVYSFLLGIESGNIEVFKVLIGCLSRNEFISFAQELNIPNLVIKSGKLEMFKYLCDILPNPILADYNGYTTIHFAAQNGHLAFVKCLCQKVPNPILLDRDGNSPIHFAALNGHFDIVKFLTNFTFFPNLPNVEGVRPSSLAKSKGYGNIEKFLVLSAQKRKLKILKLNTNDSFE